MFKKVILPAALLIVAGLILRFVGCPKSQVKIPVSEENNSTVNIQYPQPVNAQGHHREQSNLYFQELQNCLPEAAQHFSPTQQWLALARERSLPMQKSLHFTNKENQKRRMLILPKDGEVTTPSFEIRLFAEDAEGLPVPLNEEKQILQAAQVANFIKTTEEQLASQLSYIEERYQFKIDNKWDVEMFFINSMTQEFILRSQNKSLFCHQQQCQCISGQ